MAQVWANHLAPELVIARSAGMDVREISPNTQLVMREAGLDLSHIQPTRVNAEILEWADLIVTLNDSVEEQCPVIDTYAVKLHHPLVDPLCYKGRSQDDVAEYQEARDKVRQCVMHLVQQLKDYQAMGENYFIRRS